MTYDHLLLLEMAMTIKVSKEKAMQERAQEARDKKEGRYAKSKNGE